MRRHISLFGSSFFALSLSAVPALSAAAPARAVPVDLELVLAADTSQSIDQREAYLQRQGVNAAFRSPELLRAIQSGTLGKIAVAYLDWSGEWNNRIVVDWTVIQDKASGDGFAAAVLKNLTYGEGTSIGGAIAQAVEMIESNSFEGTRRTIDISGDGPANRGRPVHEVSDEAAAKGITINGLPIVTEEMGEGDWGDYYGDLPAFYRNCVIGGRGAFSLPAKGFQDFAAAMRRKLVLEISDLAPEERPAVMPAAAMPVPQARPAAPALVPQRAPAKRVGCGSELGRFRDF